MMGSYSHSHQCWLHTHNTSGGGHQAAATLVEMLWASVEQTWHTYNFCILLTTQDMVALTSADEHVDKTLCCDSFNSCASNCNTQDTGHYISARGEEQHLNTNTTSTCQ